MTHPKVSIIILNYKQTTLTLDCLASLATITYPNYELIVVDNNSQDDSQIFTKRFPKINFVQSTTNLGYAGGNNLGLTHATGTFILILNNDTKVTSGFLEPLVEDLESDSSLGIVQSKIFTMEQSPRLDGVTSYQTITGFLYHRGYLDTDKPEYSSLLYSFSAKGACILLRREILQLGLFDPDYFAYFEETDLCWRTWLQGYQVAYEPRSIIYHKRGATSSIMKSDFINYHSFKNRIRTILKNSSATTLLWMLPIHLTVCVGLVIFFLFSGQKGGATSILNAMWWNIRVIGNTWLIRSTIQSARKTSDFAIFAKVMKNPSLSFYLHHLSLVRGNLAQ